MGYQRAQWRSGLLYRQICETCRGTVTYTDHCLDFRPWYADGFVDCPTCGTHLRHNERYAIDANGNPLYGPVQTAPQATGFTATFCTKCGKKFGDGDMFCAGCGEKRT